ncbi:MAG: toxin-antitoxin system YwqK family antitoxin [Flavobacteriales bacterium]|nr:toxin-antitoxin system YwqK family antitoxin [Crocinitomicaceae bacterium]NBX80745.1 toxin-antitoxin system YwqK family antitoxin [Flavobacteriales bacterium]
MKFSIISYLLVFVSMSTFSQNEPCYKKKKICDLRLVTNCNELVAYDDKTNTYLSKRDYTTPFNGKCSACYRNGVLQEQIIVVNGKRDSTGESYYESGCMQSKQTFVLGKLNGKSTFYYDSTGRKEIEVSHYLDKLDGLYILYENNPKNDTIKIISYKNNVYDGPQKEYFENSKLAKVVYYKNGVLNGKHQTYNYDGKMEIDMNFVDGKKHGTWKFYYPNGLEARVENWNMNVKNGEFKTTTDKGIVLSREFFKKDIPEGTQTLNFPDGKPRHTTVYEKGKIVEEIEYEELTGAKHVILERVDKKAKKEQDLQQSTTLDDNPEDIVNDNNKKKKGKKEKPKKEKKTKN